MNYFLLGATWTEGGQPPAGSFNSSSGGNVVGTSKLNNTTMETYTQGTGNLWAGGAINCLDCHTTNTTSVSHDYPAIRAFSSNNRCDSRDPTQGKEIGGPRRRSGSSDLEVSGGSSFGRWAGQTWLGFAYQAALVLGKVGR